MKRNFLIITLCSLVFGVFFPIAQTAAMQRQPNKIEAKLPAPKSAAVAAPEARFALLVGINNYDDATMNLSGCANDVKLIEELLTDNYKFKAATDIKELVSSDTSRTEKPTKANIEKYFREFLIKNARDFKEKNSLTADKGATVVFYYSGHGSHLDDQPTVKEGKDEADGQDETIVPADSSRDAARERDIRDDDINAWFSELRQYTTNITFIFDSCHSGTATRGAGNRSIERKTTSKAAGTRGNSDTPLNETMDASRSYVTISGSLPNEKSQEDSLPVMPKTGEKTPDETAAAAQPKMQIDGFMTYFLVQEARGNPGISYRELMQRVSTAVNKKNPDQTPQIEGDIDRAFLGSSESRGRRSIAIRKIEKEILTEGAKDVTNTILTIEAGRIVGALPGGSVGVYKPTATELAGDTDRIAVGRIIEAKNFTSKVRITGADVTDRAKVILATPFFTDEKRRVAIDTSGAAAASQMAKRLKTLLDTNDYVAPVETRIDFAAKQKDWNAAIVRGKFADFKQGKLKSTKDAAKLPKDADEVFYLASPNGNPLYNFWVAADQPDAAEQIKDALEKHTRVENILALDNAAAKMAGGLKIEMVRLKSFKVTGDENEPCVYEEYTADERKKLADANEPLNPGDWFYFVIANNTDKDFFMYLYDIGTDGAIQKLIAPEADGDIVPRGKSIPSFRGSDCSGAVLQASEPFGKETFKLIATSKRFDADLLTSPKIARDIGLRSDSALESIFAQTSTNKRSDKVQIPFSGWATAKFEIEVIEKRKP